MLLNGKRNRLALEVLTIQSCDHMLATYCYLKKYGLYLEARVCQSDNLAGTERPVHEEVSAALPFRQTQQQRSIASYGPYHK
ncbi:hypothetical protein D3C81_2188750 [compost metagenome]